MNVVIRCFEEKELEYLLFKLRKYLFGDPYDKKYSSKLWNKFQRDYKNECFCARLTSMKKQLKFNYCDEEYYKHKRVYMVELRGVEIIDFEDFKRLFLDYIN